MATVQIMPCGTTVQDETVLAFRIDAEECHLADLGRCSFQGSLMVGCGFFRMRCVTVFLGMGRGRILDTILTPFTNGSFVERSETVRVGVVEVIGVSWLRLSDSKSIRCVGSLGNLGLLAGVRATPDGAA